MGMDKENFIAINIVIKEKTNSTIINEFPIIFYWNGESEIVHDFYENKNFKNLIAKTFTFDLYDKSYINLEYVNTNTDESKEKTFAVQDLFPFAEMDDILISNFKFDYLEQTFRLLYSRVLKEGYKNENLKESQVIIRDLYDRIKNGVTKPVSKDTIVNYIREQLLEKTKLSKQNIDHLINILNYIVTEP